MITIHKDWFKDQIFGKKFAIYKKPQKFWPKNFMNEGQNVYFMTS